MAKKKEEREEFDFIFSLSKIPDLKSKWPLFLSLGILLAIVGVLAMAFAGWTTIFTIELLGFFLIAGGIFQMINGVQARKWMGVSLSILLGILYIVFGGICIFRPIASAEGITLLLAAFFFVAGLFRMSSSLMYRFERWGWMFISGVISFLLGILIIAEWPIAAFWLIGLFVGIDLLFSGLNWIFLSLSAKKELDK